MTSSEHHTDVQERARRRLTIWDDISREVKHLEVDYVRETATILCTDLASNIG